jgi:hypothetical protein
MNYLDIHERKKRNAVTGFKHHWTTKWIVLFIAVGLFWGGQSIFPRETNLEGLFKWAIKNYLDGKYREVIKDLELLLSYCDEDHNQLKGKIYLLLGAVHEQLDNIPEARKYYQLSREIIETPSMEGVDLTFLKEYQRIFMNKKKPVVPGIIEKPKTKPAKRKSAALWLILGGVVIAGAAALLMLKKDKPVTSVRYSLNIHIAGEGSIVLSPSGGRYTEGTPVTLTARPSIGWRFDNWSGDLTGVENPTTIVMNSDKYVTANFTEINPGYYSLTVSTVGQGTVTIDPAGGIYLPGTMVKLTAFPGPGWEFYSWYGDLSVSENPTNIIMDFYKNVTAAFTETSAVNKLVGNIVVFSRISTSHRRTAVPFTMPVDGTIHSITIYHLAGTGRMILAVYDGEGLPGNRLGLTPETNVNSSDSWQTINLTSPVTARGGQTIWLTWLYENNPGIAYRESMVVSSFYSSLSWGGGMPEQFGDCTQSFQIYSIYATYTPD